MAQREADSGVDRRTGPEAGGARRRLRPTNVVVIVVLLMVLGLAAVGWTRLVGSALGHGPAGQPDDPGTTRQEAERRAQGDDPRGSNSSQDSYTSQNQSREPEQR